MPATVDTKGVASGWSYEEDDWGTLMNRNMRILSALVADGFGQNILTTSGLTYGYRGGVGLTGSGLADVAAGTITLPASTTSYVVRNVAGVVSSTTNPVFPAFIHLATVVTNATNIVSVSDERYFQDVTQDGTQTIVNLAAFAAISGASIAVTGNATVGGNAAVTGGITGANVAVATSTFPNDVRSGVGSFGGGASQGADGTLALAAIVNPSATPANRYVALQSGDAATVRGMQLRASRVFIGTNVSPAYTSDEYLGVEGPVRLQAGGGGLRLGPGSVDRTFAEFYARTATPNVRSGYIGFGIAGGTGLTLANEIGALSLTANTGTVNIVGSQVVADVPVVAPSFIGSGAGLATDTVPQAAVVGLPAALSGLAAVDAALDTRVDALELARPFLSVVSDNVPVARVNFGAALGYTGASTGARGFNTILSVLPAAGVAYNQAAQQDLVDEVNQMRDCFRQLAADLTARGVL